jgi:hypothetical protein
MVADIKKCQTMINVVAEVMVEIRAGVARMEAVKALFETVNPDVTGTVLEGNLATVNSALAALKAEAELQIWSDLIAAYVPSHRGAALEEV